MALSTARPKRFEIPRRAADIRIIELIDVHQSQETAQQRYQI
jgi:hypothetical protein